jgi:2-dehydro-3-deoxyphosphogalactonate aldolase
MTSLPEALDAMPYIAILRGVTPEQVLAVSEVLVDAGIRAIEIPMNSPEPFRSIDLLARSMGPSILVGCGTVTTSVQLQASYDAGARLVLHPHADARLVRAAKALNMSAVPGVATPTEAFGMLEAGADALKFFPSEVITPMAAASMRAVLPRHTVIVSVGGLTAHNIPDYWSVGVSGFGLGSSVYRPGWDAAQVAAAVAPLVEVAGRLVRTAEVASR